MKLGPSLALFCCAAATSTLASAEDLKITDKGYFAKPGLDVMVFSDF